MVLNIPFKRNSPQRLQIKSSFHGRNQGGALFSLDPDHIYIFYPNYFDPNHARPRGGGISLLNEAIAMVL